jgi:peptide/nickel transport system permease protein
MLPPDASVAQIDNLRRSLGFDKPLIEQFGIYLYHLVQFNLGQSLKYGEPTAKLIMDRLPATIELATASLVFSLAVAIPAGIVSAIKRHSAAEYGVMTLVLIGQSMPVFWVGILLILLFSVELSWFPTGGYGGITHLVLPAIALGLHLMALVTRLLRSSLIQAINSDYIRTARAKGLLPRVVIGKHALRNSLLPVVTVVGLEIGALLGGSVVTETIFAWPGVGQLLVQAIHNRDFPLVQGAVIMLAGIFVLINLLVDLCYAFIDPRIQYK